MGQTLFRLCTYFPWRSLVLDLLFVSHNMNYTVKENKIRFMKEIFRYIITTVLFEIGTNAFDI